MARLTIAGSARADLRGIRGHIAQDNPQAARRLVERFRAGARRVAERPGMGRSRQEDLRPGLFSFPVGSYVLFYQMQPGGIVLVRVVHGSRDLPAIFGGTEG